jgi:AraC-like DNA-binding protein
MTEAGERIKWLLTAEDPERTAPEPMRIAFEDSCWRALIERFRPSDELILTLSSADISREFVFDAQQAEPEPWLLCHIPVEGRARLTLPDGAATDVDASRSAFFLPVDRRAMFTLPPQTGLRHAGIAIRSDRVQAMFGDELPEWIAALITDSAGKRLIAATTSGEMRRLASSLFQDSLRGALRSIFMEGVALQLVALQTSATVRDEPARRPPSQRSRRKIEEARDLLLANMEAPPSLSALASAVGISSKALNVGFRRLYGGTVFEILRNERLEHARLALLDERLSIKQIAHRVGYSHVANFTAAFTRLHGEPPLRYRKGRVRPPP